MTKWGLRSSIFINISGYQYSYEGEDIKPSCWSWKDRKKDHEDDEKEDFIEMGNEIYKLLKITPVFNSNMGFIKPFNFQLWLV